MSHVAVVGGGIVGLASTIELLRGGLSTADRLVNVDAYIGGLYLWLLAGIFWLTGVSALTPRLLMAVAGAHDLPGVIVPGGVTLPANDGEDAGKVQTLGARFAHGAISLEEAAEMGCRACASPGGGCQFLGTAATSQVVAEALGLAVVHSALAPSGQPVWLDMARRSARGVLALRARKKTVRDTNPNPGTHDHRTTGR